MIKFPSQILSKLCNRSFIQIWGVGAEKPLNMFLSPWGPGLLTSGLDYNHAVSLLKWKEWKVSDTVFVQRRCRGRVNKKEMNNRVAELSSIFQLELLSDTDPFLASRRWQGIFNQCKVSKIKRQSLHLDRSHTHSVDQIPLTYYYTLSFFSLQMLKQLEKSAFIVFLSRRDSGYLSMPVFTKL